MQLFLNFLITFHWISLMENSVVQRQCLDGEHLGDKNFDSSGDWQYGRLREAFWHINLLAKYDEMIENANFLRCVIEIKYSEKLLDYIWFLKEFSFRKNGLKSKITGLR